MLRSASPNNLTHQLVQELGKAIVSERYMVDQGFPSEAEICEQYQISRTATRDTELGGKAIRVRASFMPGRGHTVAEKLERLTLHEIDLENGAVLETGCVYIVPLMESLDLPADISASANPKSSTGRLDIFTRVMVDYAQEFDKVPAGYKGQLYLGHQIISCTTLILILRKIRIHH